MHFGLWLGIISLTKGNNVSKIVCLDVNNNLGFWSHSTWWPSLPSGYSELPWRIQWIIVENKRTCYNVSLLNILALLCSSLLIFWSWEERKREQIYWKLQKKISETLLTINNLNIMYMIKQLATIDSKIFLQVNFSSLIHFYSA